MFPPSLGTCCDTEHEVAGLLNPNKTARTAGRRIFGARTHDRLRAVTVDAAPRETSSPSVHSTGGPALELAGFGVVSSASQNRNSLSAPSFLPGNSPAVGCAKVHKSPLQLPGWYGVSKVFSITIALEVGLDFRLKAGYAESLRSANSVLSRCSWTWGQLNMGSIVKCLISIHGLQLSVQSATFDTTIAAVCAGDMCVVEWGSLFRIIVNHFFQVICHYLSQNLPSYNCWRFTGTFQCTARVRVHCSYSNSTGYSLS